MADVLLLGSLNGENPLVRLIVLLVHCGEVLEHRATPFILVACH